MFQSKEETISAGSKPTRTQIPATVQPRHVRDGRWVLVITIIIASNWLFGQQPEPQADATPPQQQSTEGSASSTSTALTTPAIIGPLQAMAPITFVAGPLGKLSLDGIISGIGLWQGNHLPGDNSLQPAVSNGQVFLQKPDGWWQFYVQAGAYNILTLGTPFIPTNRAIGDLFGPVPVAYIKLAPTKGTSVMIGSLPTLMGAESTFSFQNMNIERGLVWNQENDLNRGIQLNQTVGKFTASLSWNDGFWSNRYSWLGGSLTYANGPHSIVFSGMGNLSQTKFQSLATPVQNNSTMYALVYTYTKNNWIVQPYVQYTNVPTNPKTGIVKGASTWGGALLLSRTIAHGFSLAARGEYITSTGSASQQSVNLLYGPGSAAWSLTVTPTYQHKHFFTRGDLAFVRALSFTASDGFGPAGMNRNQPRAVIEAGVLF